MDQPGDGAIIPEKSGGWTVGHVPDQTNNSLDQGPPARWVHQPHYGGEAFLQSHYVLGHLALRVSGSLVPQVAHGGLGDLLPVPSRDDGPDQRLYPPDLARGHLVLLVVAGEVGQDARCTGDNVDICAAK